MTETEAYPKRYNLSTFFLALAILVSASWAFLSLGELIGLTNLGWHNDVQELLMFGLFNLLFVIFSVVLLFLKKWGMFGLIATGLFYTISYILFFESGIALFYLIPIGTLSFAALYIRRHYDVLR